MTVKAKPSKEWATLNTQLQPIFKKWQIIKAIVFGSFARGTVTQHSDLDLLLIQDTPKRWLDRYDGILREITQVVPGRDVDLLIYTPQELEKMADSPFIKRIIQEGSVIYES